MRSTGRRRLADYPQMGWGGLSGAGLARGGARGGWPSGCWGPTGAGIRLIAARHSHPSFHCSGSWAFIHIDYLRCLFPLLNRSLRTWFVVLCMAQSEPVALNSSCASESKSFFKILTYRIPYLKSRIQQIWGKVLNYFLIGNGQPGLRTSVADTKTYAKDLYPFIKKKT